MSPTPATQGRSTLLMMDLLSLGDRPVLRDLARWCDLLLSDLRAPASTGDLMVVSTALNQYALIEALRGHGERAEAACHAQIRWVVRTAGAMGDRRLLAHAMQPWVNLGRLHRRAGAHERACRHFALIDGWRDGCDSLPAEWEAGDGLQDALAGDPVLVETLWAIAIVDTFKALVGHDPAAALAHLERQRQGAPARFRFLIDEATLIALECAGQRDEALAVPLAAEADAQGALAMLIQRTALLVMMGRHDEATALACRLAAALVQPGAVGVAPTALLRQRLHLGDVLQALGQVDYATALWRAGHRLGEELGDQRHALHAAERLARQGGGLIAWPAVAGGLRALCRYADVLDACCGDPVELIDLRSAVADLLARDVGAPAHASSPSPVPAEFAADTFPTPTLRVAQAAALHAAYQLGIAEHLVAAPCPIPDLARRLGAQPSALHRLLRALATIGLCHEARPGWFSATSGTRVLRRAGAEHPLEAWSHPDQFSTWGRLAESVRTGKPAFPQVTGLGFREWLARERVADRRFHAGIHHTTVTAHAAMARHWSWTTTGTVVDVGGGAEGLLRAVMRRFPTLHGVLFNDTPTTITTDRSADRLRFRHGDLCADVPAGGDVYLVGHLLHGWDDADARRLLCAVRGTMRDDALVLVIEDLILPGDQPQRGKWMDLEMLAFRGGRERTADEYAAAAHQAGLVLDRVLPTGHDASILVLRPTATVDAGTDGP